MAFQIATIPQSGAYFKPAEAAHAVAFLIEVTGFNRQVPGQFGPKDEAVATISQFNTQADLDNGTPTVSVGTKIQQTLLARDLGAVVGQAVIVTLAKKPATKPGQQDAWVWRTLTGEAQAKVIAYAEKREADRAEAVSGDDAPLWLKG